MRPSPSFCWWCRGQLSLDKTGKPIFAVVRDPVGNEHHTHKTCAEPAEKDLKGLTAQPADNAKIGGRSWLK